MPHSRSDPVAQANEAYNGHFGPTEAGAMRCGDEGLSKLGNREVVGPAA